MLPSGEQPDIEALLCACLRGEQPAWPFGHDQASIALFLERAEFHGVQPLLHHLVSPDRATEQGWPAEVLAACRQQAIAQTMWELRHQHLLEQVVTDLGEAGIQPVLFKGTALAYSLYPSPALRSRADSDLIIAPQQRFKASDILAAQGFAAQHDVSCEFLSYEASFTRFESTVTHMLDLHWRIHYSQLQSGLLAYEVLRERAIPLPAIGPHARGVDPVYALLIACLHRANNLLIPQWIGNRPSYGDERLIWLYDFHLLLESMTLPQLSEFAALAKQKGLKTICREGIDQARACFHTRLPIQLQTELAIAAADEPIIRYQKSGMLRQRWMDWLALRDPRDRFLFLWEHAFPPAAYLRQRFPHAAGRWLPLLYLRRLGEGIWRRVQSRIL